MAEQQKGPALEGETAAQSQEELEQNFDFDSWVPGRDSMFVWSPEPMYTRYQVHVPEMYDDDGSRDLEPLSDEAYNTLLELDAMFTNLDETPYRTEIEQAWKMSHYKRGYQFLAHHRNGGWIIPGASLGWDSNKKKHTAARYNVNVYAEKLEIVSSALSNEVPRVQFDAINPKSSPDIIMVESAEVLQQIWAKNNDLPKILRDAADIFCTTERALCITRYELNGADFGYEDDEEPLVPEDEQKPPTKGDGVEEDEYQEANKSPLLEDEGEGDLDDGEKKPSNHGKPRGRAMTFVLDKLHHKVVINVSGMGRMHCLYYVEDTDKSILRARYPWIATHIQGGGDGVAASEFCRIARENVCQALPDQYIVGDAMDRHAQEKFVYMKTEYFHDEKVKPEVRKELLAKFPDGLLMVKVGTEVAFVRNEYMADHCYIAHAASGAGQNRKALLESLIPIQDYINEKFNLLLDYAKRCVTKRWFNDRVFNLDKMKTSGNLPGTIGGFTPDPSLTTKEQYMMMEDQPQPHPWLVQWVQWLISTLTEQISHAMPSMFGKGITGQVGSEGVGIQRDQALQCESSPWASLKWMFAVASLQAVRITAKCTNADIDDVIPGKGPVSVRLSNLKGSVMCYPDMNPAFPQSWAQKETRLDTLIKNAAALGENNPFVQDFADPENRQTMAEIWNMPDWVVKGDNDVKKQRGEFELLLRQKPIDNPEFIKAKALSDTLVKVLSVLHIKAQQVQAGQAQFTQQEQADYQMLPKKLEALEQQMNQMPKLLPSIRPRPDRSEDHVTQAAVCVNWMNSTEGRKYEFGSSDKQAGFLNVYLHWQAHQEILEKLAEQDAKKSQPAPKVSFSANAKDLPAPEAAAVVTAGGIPANPADWAGKQKQDLNDKVAEKVIPEQAYLQTLHNQ